MRQHPFEGDSSLMIVLKLVTVVLIQAMPWLVLAAAWVLVWQTVPALVLLGIGVVTYGARVTITRRLEWREAALYGVATLGKTLIVFAGVL